MEIPDLVRRRLGDEEVRTAISLGDGDVACFTPTRTLVYGSEGLLSDESLTEYGHDFERLATSDGRRKTKFTLEYVDGTEQLTVSNDRRDAVLRGLLEGYLRVNGGIETEESAAGVFRFSELTLLVTTGRLLKHVGEYTWDEDFEGYPFADVTGLSFEDGSVATAVVLEVDGRPERIKAPNEKAPHVRKTLEEALFDHYDVGSLEALNRTVEIDEDEGQTNGSNADEDPTRGLNLGSGLDPLVGRDDPNTDTGGETGADNWQPLKESDDEATPDRRGPDETDDGAGTGGGRNAGDGTGASAGSETSDGATTSDSSVTSGDPLESPTTDAQRSTPRDQRVSEGAEDQTVRESSTGGVDRSSSDRPPEGRERDRDWQAVTDQLAELTSAVEQQNDLLEKQRRTIEQLVDELRRNR